VNALILVCALSVSAPDCQKETSIHVFYAPETQANITGCLTDGMLYASQSGLVEEGTYSKIVCKPDKIVAQFGG
jgi:hypothetical protein